MAKKKSATATNTEGSGTTMVPDAPDGFGIKVGRERGDGWAVKKEGNEVVGRLMGRHEFKGLQGKTRAYYQIVLQKEALASVTDPDVEDAEPVEMMLPVGSTLNVDEMASLKDLAPYTKDGSTYDVWFCFGGTRDVGQPSPMRIVHGPRLKVIQRASEIPS